MAKPLELIAEISGKEAESFIKNMENPRPNPAREETIRRAKALNFPF
jgi:hypothetical protein